MSEKCETNWSPTEDQIDKITIPAIQCTAQQYASMLVSCNVLLHLSHKCFEILLILLKKMQLQAKKVVIVVKPIFNSSTHQKAAS